MFEVLGEMFVVERGPEKYEQLKVHMYKNRTFLESSFHTKLTLSIFDIKIFNIKWSRLVLQKTVMQQNQSKLVAFNLYDQKVV